MIEAINFLAADGPDADTAKLPVALKTKDLLEGGNVRKCT